MRSRKIRIYPTQAQKKLLKNWFGTTRYIYNYLLEKIRTGEIKDKTNWMSISKEFNSKEANKLPPWAYEVPNEVRKGAIRDLSRAFKTVFASLQSGAIKHFEIKRRIKKGHQSLEIPGRAISRLVNKDGEVQVERPFLKIYAKTLGEVKIAKGENRKLTIDENTSYSRICFKRNQWFLCIPIKVRIQARRAPYGIVALDPGVRTFQTTFSENETIKFQQRTEVLTKLRMKIYDCRKRGTKRTEERCWSRMENLITELHHKTITYLLNYKTILCPNFETKRMGRKGKLAKSTNQLLYTLSHYRFRERLKDRCEVNSREFRLCNEAYTSQTCTYCGNLRKTSNKTYKCTHCNIVMDRDVMGARNILLKCS